MKTHFNILIFILISFAGFAQQNAQYNQYIFNQLVINPAYAGTKEMINVNSIYSSQWSGLEGAPTTQSLSFETPLFGTMGVGVHIVNDKIGAQSNQSGYGSYSYKLRLNQTLKISFGLAMGASYYNLNGNILTNDSQYDPAIPQNQNSKMRFDSKFGLFLYSNKFYAGFSVSDLTSNLRKSAELLVAGQVKHYYLTAGYLVNINKDIKYKPSIMVKEDFLAPTNVDLNSYFLLKNKFWIGATFRSGANIFKSKDLDNTLRTRDAVVVMADVNISDNFRIGYAYTITVSALNNYAGHEIALGYYVREKAKTKMLTPRYF